MEEQPVPFDPAVHTIDADQYCESRICQQPDELRGGMGDIFVLLSLVGNSETPPPPTRILTPYISASVLISFLLCKSPGPCTKAEISLVPLNSFLSNPCFVYHLCSPGLPVSAFGVANGTSAMRNIWCRPGV